MLRSLDHLVLPAASLKAARTRLGALGFTLAADGVHPFGTANACVYFSDGTFLEPLVVADSFAAEAAIAAGNVFVAHDAEYRQALGDEGFSALVISSDDARADDAAFRANAVSCGPVLDFGRDFVDPDGNRDRIDFRLAFARPAAMPLALVFSCQRINAPNADRSALERHANGVSGISRIVLEAPDIAAAAAFFRAMLGDPGEGPVFALGKARLEIATGEGPARFTAIRFRTPNLAKIAAMLDRAGIGYHRHNGIVAVAPAPGQGATFEFEDENDEA